MATRAEIRDAITAEMESVSGTYAITDADGAVLDTFELSAEHIGLRDPEYTETLPAVVYHDNYRPVEYNGVGRAPQKVHKDTDGNVIEEESREYMEAQYLIDVRGSNESQKEPIYEAIRTRFARYNFEPYSVKDVHDDVQRIEVRDSTTTDTGDTEDVIRGEQLEVRIRFYRDYRYNTDNIETVYHGVDVDSDDEIDYTYTTTLD